MPKTSSEIAVLGKHERAQGAYYLLLRAAIAAFKVTFLNKDADRILQRNAITPEDFLGTVQDFALGNKASWADLLDGFERQEGYIRLYLSDCSSKEREAVSSLCGKAGFEFFQNISPFAGFKVCIYRVPSCRSPSTPLSFDHMLAVLAAGVDVNKPGDRALFFFHETEGYHVVNITKEITKE